jgi:hypothetical protein
LFGYSHGAREGHDDETFLVTGHGFEHVGSFAKLASSEGGVRHGAYEVVYGRDLAQVERFERDEAIGNGIVKFALDACALFVRGFFRMAWLVGAFLLQGNSSMEIKTELT